MSAWMLALVFTSCFLCCVAFIFSIVNYIELRSQQKSTHQIQYVPLEPQDDWAIDDEKLNEHLDELQDDALNSDPDDLFKSESDSI